MTVTQVSGLFLPALNLLPPFPWEAYVHEVLAIHWGGRLGEAGHLLASLQALAADRKVELPSDRSSFLCRVQLNTYDSRELPSVYAARFPTLHLITGHASTMPAADRFDDLFRLKVSTLMPLAKGHLLSLNEREGVWYGPMPAAPGGGDVLGMSRMDGERMREVRVWLRRYADMVADMVDVERAIHGVMVQMQRDWHPVACLVYPQFEMVFPGQLPKATRYVRSGEVDHKSYLRKVKRLKPINPKFLDRLLHADDQEVIRSMFDQAAAGAKLVAEEDKLNMSILRVDYDLED
jgi:hypothetical protein